MDSSVFIGFIGIMGFSFAPENWATCEGQTLAINAQQALYALLGSMYGGDGRTTFALPDFRGRAPIGKGSPPIYQSLYEQGRSYGQESVTLTDKTTGAHSHMATFDGKASPLQLEVHASTSAANVKTPSHGDYLATNPDATECYRENAGSGTVTLGGFFSSCGGILEGNVTIGTAGYDYAFPILGTRQTLLFCIAMKGLFPSRG